MPIEKQEFQEGVVYRADCLEVLPTLEKNAVEITVTSPPYNLVKWGHKGVTDTGRAAEAQFKKWYADEMPEWEYQGKQRAVIFELLRVSRSSVFYNHKLRFAWHGRNKHRNESNCHHPRDWLTGFPLWSEIIWDRCGIGKPTGRYHMADERIYQLGKPRKWSNETGLTNIWRIPPTRNAGHVCAFPPKLVENCMLPTTDPGDLVLDPFGGSGTTALVAMKHKRRFVLIERKPEYFDLICSEIENTGTGQGALFGGGG